MLENIEVKYENKPCYNIKIRFNWDELAESLITISPAKQRKIAIISDSNVAPLYLKDVVDKIGEKFNEVLTLQFPAGEENKTLSNVQLLYEALIKNKFYRGDLLIALGGGVVGDLVGFTAATFLRGIDFVQIPTTLLSQVDSSIGGKTGVDFSEYKNMVGAFHMPKLVYINTSVLNTLDDAQFASGMGEIIKHGIIRDRDYFFWLRENSEAILNKNPEVLAKMVYDSCIIKRDVVEIDPKEKGIRAYLNFGHTIGHAVEKCSNFTLTHGQCVAIGSVAASLISQWQNYISDEDTRLIKDTLSKFNLKLSCDMMDTESILAATKSDKKMGAKGIKFVLIKSIGEAFVLEGLEEDIMRRAIEEIACG